MSPVNQNNSPKIIPYPLSLFVTRGCTSRSWPFHACVNAHTCFRFARAEVNPTSQPRTSSILPVVLGSTLSVAVVATGVVLVFYAGRVCVTKMYAAAWYVTHVVLTPLRGT